MDVSAVPSQRSPAGEAFTTLVDQVVHLVRYFTTAGDKLAEPSGQTLARWLVLEAVEAAPASVAQIARGLRLARQSVQRVADLLVRDGLAVYEENPRHRRSKLLRLTPQGLSVLRQIQKAQREWADASGAEIGEADLRQASAILYRVLRAVAEQ